MKYFRDSRGDFWERHESLQGVVICTCWSNHVRVKNGDVQILDEFEWKKTTDYRLADVELAVAKLWAAPTKDQLWRKVCKRAGELTLCWLAPNKGICIYHGKTPLQAVSILLDNAQKIELGKEFERARTRLHKALLKWAVAK